jgi:hypothetical protein
VISRNNPATAVCSLQISPEPDSYEGSNVPIGYPTTTGGNVVSIFTVQPDNILSLDQKFSSTGQLIARTPIEFRRESERYAIADFSDFQSLLLHFASFLFPVCPTFGESKLVYLPSATLHE